MMRATVKSLHTPYMKQVLSAAAVILLLTFIFEAFQSIDSDVVCAPPLRYFSGDFHGQLINGRTLKPLNNHLIRLYDGKILRSIVWVGTTDENGLWSAKHIVLYESFYVSVSTPSGLTCYPYAKNESTTELFLWREFAEEINDANFFVRIIAFSTEVE